MTLKTIDPKQMIDYEVDGTIFKIKPSTMRDTLRRNQMFSFEAKLSGTSNIEMGDEEKWLTYIKGRVESIENIDHEGQHYDVIKDRAKIDEVIEALDGDTAQNLINFLVSNTGLADDESGN